MKTYFKRLIILIVLSPFSLQLLAAESCNVNASYAGQYTADYSAGSHKGESYVFGITLSFQLSGQNLTARYLTSSGVAGEGYGYLDTETCTAKLSYHNTTPSCQGSYNGIYSFKGEDLTWEYNGQDCWGTLSGKGEAATVNID